MSDKHVRGLPHPVMHREPAPPDSDEDETQFLAVRFMPTEPLPSDSTDQQREVAAAVHRLTHSVERESRFQRVLDEVRWGQYVAGVEGRTTKFRPPPELLYASVPDSPLGPHPPGEHLEPSAPPSAPPPRRSVAPPTASPRPSPAPDPLRRRRASSSPRAPEPPPREPASWAYFWVALVLVGITAALLSPLGSGRASSSSANKAHPGSPPAATSSPGVARQ